MSHRLSRSPAARTSLAFALLGSIGIAALGASHPAVAASIIAQLNTVAACATSTACVTGTNTGASPNNGVGVSGTSANGFGVTGFATKMIGVYGVSNGTLSNSVGVYGQSPYIGVRGSTTTGNGFAVSGYTTSGTGTWGMASSGGVGAGGQSTYGTGVYASSGSGYGVYAHSAQNVGVRSSIDGGGFSVVGTSSNGRGSGADFEGGRYGIVGRAQPLGFPLVLTDSSYNNVFYVSGTGNVYLHGNLEYFSSTARGTTVSSYTAHSSEPTMEDTGTAQLASGAATVALDPTFAASIDASMPYRVFITPDGETRGLFVAAKTAHGFTVREIQGGHANIAFDYRIVATGQGQAGKRMALQPATGMLDAPSPATAAQLQPKMQSIPSANMSGQ